MHAVSRDDILTRIRDKRAEVERFLVSATPRKRRLRRRHRLPLCPTSLPAA